MSIKRIEFILTAHCIPHYINDGRIYADTMECGREIVEDVVDVTDYSAADLYDFLGY